MMDAAHSCIVCGKEASQCCAACRTVHYCSKEHQVADWKQHKVNCKNYKVEWDINTGHHIVASKDLAAGTIILKEQPLTMGPKPRKPEDTGVCLGCFEKLGGRGGQGEPCPRCKWPMCGKKECWKDGSDHAIGECLELKGARERLPPSYLNLWDPTHIYQSIFIIRCFALKDRDPVKWKELMDLKHCVPSLKLDAFKSIMQQEGNVVSLINNWLLPFRVPEEWIFNVNIALTFNTFPLDLPTGQSVFVYSDGSLFSHSCMANAEHTFTPNGKMLVRSTVPIAKGTRVTLNYSTDPLLGTMQRLRKLELTKSLGSCHCQRCSDPTELGTFASGIFCTKCPSQEGILLPEFPLEPESDWACTKCSAKQPSSVVTKLLDKVVIDSKDRNHEAFIRKYGLILHPNHYLMTGIKFHECISSTLTAELELNGKVSDEDLNRRQREILKLLDLADIISPGLTRLQGILLYNLAAVDYTAIEKELDFFNYIVPPNVTVHACLERLKHHLQEVCKIFSWGPEATIDKEHFLAGVAATMLKGVAKFEEFYNEDK